jgi:hypothetical protein
MSGGFYSFRVFAPHEVVIVENLVALDKGMNTFNVHVQDVDQFVERLKSENVRIDVMIHLDAPDPEISSASGHLLRE